MTYKAYRASEPIIVDGKLNEQSWKLAPKSPRFVNIVNGEPALYDTRAAVLWDDEYLYIGFWVEEPFIKANLTERDSLLFNENNVEIFIDGVDTYYELEVNALNTIYEVFFIWKDAYKKDGIYDTSEFDVHNDGVYTFAGNHDRHSKTFWEGTHPRGLRWAFRNWDFPGLKTATHIEGVVNDENQTSKGWTVEMALPWAGMKHLANNRPLPPKEGDLWKLQFARFEKLISLDQNVGWSWDPIGSDDNHRPEKFTTIEFSNQTISKK